MVANLRHQLALIKKVTYSAFLSVFRRSDYKTWCNARNLDPEWDERSMLLVALVPAGSSVIDFGAGRLAVKNFCRRAALTHRRISSIVEKER